MLQHTKKGTSNKKLLLLIKIGPDDIKVSEFSHDTINVDSCKRKMNIICVCGWNSICVTVFRFYLFFLCKSNQKYTRTISDFSGDEKRTMTREILLWVYYDLWKSFPFFSSPYLIQYKEKSFFEVLFVCMGVIIDWMKLDDEKGMGYGKRDAMKMFYFYVQINRRFSCGWKGER